MVEAELAAGPSAQTPPPYFNRKMADHDDDVIASDRKCRAACTCVADVLPLRFPVAAALPEVTGESCPLRRHTQPPARPLLLPSPPSTLVARWGIRRRHALHTHARTHALSRSAPLPLPLSLAAAILGRSVWNNPRVPLSICARTGARACLLISPRDTHSQHTVRRAPLLCFRAARGGFFPFFRATFPAWPSFAPRLPASLLRLLWISNTRLPAVWSGSARRGAAVTGSACCQRRERRRLAEVRKLPSRDSALFCAMTDTRWCFRDVGSLL